MRLFISAGEPSGDLHGSNLIRELQRLDPNSQFSGLGSRKMSEAGCELLKDMDDLAIMGFARVVPHLKQFWDLLWQADHHFQETRPEAVILIDYPGFNWWIARRAKKHNIPVFYYGTPQIWGWATHRVKKLRRLVDHALCKLPFEPDWYREHGCTATYVGHPYFDEFVNREIDESFVGSLGGGKFVTILPGSRKHEVEKNLPAFLKTANFVHQTVPDTKFAIASYNESQAELARSLLAQHPSQANVEVFVDRTRELIHRADCCLACSGSVSLELLHEQKPTVIHYKLNHFQDFLQSRCRKCKFITLVNLLKSERRFELDDDYDPDDIRNLEEAPFPEYFGVEDRCAEMAHHIIRWVTDEASRKQVIDSLQPLRENFVKPGASKLAAAYILDRLGHRTANPIADGAETVQALMNTSDGKAA